LIYLHRYRSDVYLKVFKNYYNEKMLFNTLIEIKHYQKWWGRQGDTLGVGRRCAGGGTGMGVGGCSGDDGYRWVERHGQTGHGGHLGKVKLGHTLI